MLEDCQTFNSDIVSILLRVIDIEGSFIDLYRAVNYYLQETET